MDINLILQVSLLDVIITILLMWGVYKGYQRGFFVHALSLFVLIIGIFVSIKITQVISDYIIDRSTVPLLELPVILFGVLFTVMVFISHVSSDMIEKAVDKLEKNLTMRLLGVVFSTIKYLLFISIFLIFVYKLDASFNYLAPKEKERTKLYEPFMQFGPALFPYLRFDAKNPIPKTSDKEGLNTDTEI